MAITDVAARTAKPREKEYKLTDSHGLYLLVKPTGSKRWYLKYRFEGKESRVALGAYLSESVKHRYYQCVNVLCSATFRSMEAVDTIIRQPVTSGEPEDEFIHEEMDKMPKQRLSA